MGSTSHSASASRRGGARRAVAFVGLAAIVVVAAAVATRMARSGGSGGSDGVADARPNVVVVMTDDQALRTMHVMERTQRLLGDAGTTYTRSYVNYPLCCPSRSTFLTGQHAHNHGVRDNIPPAGGFLRLDGTETLPVWLHRAGYRTIHVGRYLNRYGKDSPPSVPPGWDQWFGLVDPSTFAYYGYRVYDGKRVTRFGDDPADYQTDVLADRAVQAIVEAAGHDPFFLTFAPLAPHVTGEYGTDTVDDAEPAPRHADAFSDEPSPIAPRISESDRAGKPGFIRGLEPLTDDEQEEITAAYRAGLETLLAVDEAVERIVEALARTGVLDDTVIVYTSDNGFFWGEHGIRSQKTFLYEPAVRVPLIVRGPGFPKGATVDVPVSNVDLAPTILALAGARPGLVMDGRPLPVESSARAGERLLLLDNRNGGARAQSTAVVGTRWFWAEHSNGETELYDLAADPGQRRNLSRDPALADLRDTLARRLAELRDCAGNSCG